MKDKNIENKQITLNNKNGPNFIDYNSLKDSLNKESKPKTPFDLWFSQNSEQNKKEK